MVELKCDKCNLFCKTESSHKKHVLSCTAHNVETRSRKSLSNVCVSNNLKQTEENVGISMKQNEEIFVKEAVGNVGNLIKRTSVVKSDCDNSCHIFKCGKCSNKFESQQQLDTHHFIHELDDVDLPSHQIPLIVESNNKSPITKIDIRTLIKRQKDTTKMENSPKRTKFQCENCNSIFKKQGNFKDHLDNHCNGSKESFAIKAKFDCSFCNKSFRGERNYNSHVKHKHAVDSAAESHGTESSESFPSTSSVVKRYRKQCDKHTYLEDQEMVDELSQFIKEKKLSNFGCPSCGIFLESVEAVQEHLRQKHEQMF